MVILVIRQGLTPQLFWPNRVELLACPRDAIEELVARLVTLGARRDADGVGPLGAWRAPPTPITKVGGRVMLCAVEDLPRNLPVDIPGTCDTQREVAFVVIVDELDAPLDQTDKIPLPPEGLSNGGVARSDDGGENASKVLRVHLPPGKRRGQHVFTHDVLPRVISFSSSQLNLGRTICVAGGDGGIGVALVLLQVFFDDDGRMRGGGGSGSGAISKSSVRTRLEWIIADRPGTNPSRAMLKKVNNFLLSPHHHWDRLVDKNRRLTCK
jgi:tRNA A64-2'-O-ribosylphosphate transferase